MRKSTAAKYQLVTSLRVIANNAQRLIDDINLGLLQQAKTLIAAGLVHRHSESLNQLVSDSHSRKRPQTKRTR